MQGKFEAELQKQVAALKEQKAQLGNELREIMRDPKFRQAEHDIRQSQRLTAIGAEAVSPRYELFPEIDENFARRPLLEQIQILTEQITQLQKNKERYTSKEFYEEAAIAKLLVEKELKEEFSPLPQSLGTAPVQPQTNTDKSAAPLASSAPASRNTLTGSRGSSSGIPKLPLRKMTAAQEAALLKKDKEQWRKQTLTLNMPTEQSKPAEEGPSPSVSNAAPISSNDHVDAAPIVPESSPQAAAAARLSVPDESLPTRKWTGAIPSRFREPSVASNADAAPVAGATSGVVNPTVPIPTPPTPARPKAISSPTAVAPSQWARTSVSGSQSRHADNESLARTAMQNQAKFVASQRPAAGPAANNSEPAVRPQNPGSQK